MLSRSAQLLDKSESALIAAIEIYNKPDFEYREETFSILALNAWELLLKAKLLSDAGNDPRSLYVYERRRTKSGEWSKREYIKRNRAGNPHTKGLGQLVAQLDADPATRLSPAVKNNLRALTEVRDNAVHFVNASPTLAKQVLEIGTASVKNFVELTRRWFDRGLSEYHLYLMPIGFVAAPGVATAVALSQDETKLVDYLSHLMTGDEGESAKGFHVALEVNLSFKRSSADATAAVRVTDEPGAAEVTLTEEDVRRIYPWDYADLTQRLRHRYVDFKANQKYHRIRQPLNNDPRYVKSRYLDPGNPRSAKKDFYNPNIVREFDKHYTLQ